MVKIQESMAAFTLAVRQGKSVNCNEKGEWWCEGVLMRIVRWLFRLHDRRIDNLARQIIQQLNAMECQTVVLGPKGCIVTPLDAAFTQKESFNLFRDAATAVASQVRRGKTATALRQRIAALNYRMGVKLGGEKRAKGPRAEDLQRIETMASACKQEQKPRLPAALTEVEKRQIRELCRYQQFVPLLFKDKALAEACLKWCVVLNNPVDAFVLYPHHQQLIRENLFSARSFRFNGNLKVTKKEGKHGIRKRKLQLTLAKPIDLDNLTKGYDVQQANILKHDKTRLIGTFAAILRDFGNKNFDCGNYEMFQVGVLPWNAAKMAWYNHRTKTHTCRILEVNDVRDAVPHLETVPKEVVEKRYGLPVPLKEGQVVGVVKGTRSTPNIDMMGNHGYNVVATPSRFKPGAYDIYTFGKFAQTFPRTTWENVKIAFNTVVARLQTPDANEFYLREHCASAYIRSPEGGTKLLHDMHNLFKASLQGKLTFQLAAKNCTYEAQTFMQDSCGRAGPGERVDPAAVDGKVPDVFNTSVYDLELGGFLGVLHGVINKVPTRMRNWTLRKVVWCLGGSRKGNIDGKVSSVMDSFFITQEGCYHATTLCRHIQAKRIHGLISIGSRHPSEITS